MTRVKLSLFLLSSMAVAACVSLPAQTDPGISSQHVRVLPLNVEPDELPGAHVKIVPAPVLVPSGGPFALEKGTGFGQPVQVLSEAGITAHDRDLVADAQSSIQERAGFENLDFNGQGWTYQQLVCPALPNHLFLRFSRDTGMRQMSMFAAAIPRNGDGRVHIIPILRKGYSLFSPAPIGALTIAAFNRIRAEENTDAPADWLGTGLCYAALAGANPESEAATAGSDQIGETPAAIAPTLVVNSDGGVIIRFADVSTSPHPMEWNMFFNPRGKLLKATHAPATVLRYRSREVPRDVGEAKP